MKSIYFICQWGKNKKKAWSGTCWSLYKALSNYFDLIDVPIKSNIWSQLKLYLYKKYNFIKYDFLYHDVCAFNKSRVAKLISGKACSIQFSELDLSESVHSYIYQDMCINFIQDVILKDELLSRYFRKNVSYKILETRKRKQRDYYSSCKGIFVMGEWLRNYMIQEMGINPQLVHCIGAGCDIDTFKCDTRKRKSNKILFVGRDFERKGGRFLAEAFSILKTKYQTDAELYIAGPNIIPEDLKKDGVVFLGSVDANELIEYYGLCDVFCMPSYLEPYGKVYIEALCCAMPVIARNSFASSDFVINGVNGYLIDKDDSEELAIKMYDLLHNDTVKEYAYQHAHENREYYSWDAVAGRMAKVISEDMYMKE